MSMNESDHLYEYLLDFLQEKDGYNEKAVEALSRLDDLADPQSEELRQLRKEVIRLQAECDRARKAVVALDEREKATRAKHERLRAKIRLWRSNEI